MIRETVYDGSSERSLDGVVTDANMELLRAGNPISLMTGGMSMYPIIKSRDFVNISHVDVESIRVGDIIIFSTESSDTGSLVGHRVVRIMENAGRRKFVTKGDFDPAESYGEVDESRVLGRVTGIARRGTEIELEGRAWSIVNRAIAYLSQRNMIITRIFTFSLTNVIEWRYGFAKMAKWINKGDPILHNTEKLLLLCSVKHIRRAAITEAASLIKEGVNWQIFFDYAFKSGNSVLVHEAMNLISSEIRIPKKILDRFKSLRYSITSNAEAQYSELMGLLLKFSELGIAAMPLKGVLLSEKLYRDRAARGSSVDFDLLIRKADLDRSVDMLKGIGYKIIGNNEIDAWRWHYKFFKKGNTLVDLRWNVTMTDKNPIRLKELWERARPVDIDGTRYYRPGEEELLLYLALHLVHSDSFNQLRYVSDIHALITSDENKIDWRLLSDMSHDWGVPHSLYTSIFLSKDFFNTDVPFEAIRKVEPPFLKKAFIRMFANRKVIFRNCLRKRLINRFFGYTLFDYLEARSFNDYRDVFLKVLFPPKEVLDITRRGDGGPIAARYMKRLFTGGVKVIFGSKFSNEKN
ncbi:MAG: signal peptidase I [Candidatus Omnitrophica bacterium]|nr:signal peptidase I [Candidatus Omnitrophota bacterium]